MTRNIAGDKYFPKVSRGFWRHLVHAVDMMSQHTRNDSTQAILSFTRSRRRTSVNYFFLVYRKWRVCTVEVSSKGSWSFWERELTNQSESFRYFFELDFLREKKKVSDKRKGLLRDIVLANLNATDVNNMFVTASVCWLKTWNIKLSKRT